eukprot:1157211-Pelagomonas_calceolata.AAC.1
MARRSTTYLPNVLAHPDPARSPNKPTLGKGLSCMVADCASHIRRRRVVPLQFQNRTADKVWKVIHEKVVGMVRYKEECGKEHVWQCRPIDSTATLDIKKKETANKMSSSNHKASCICGSANHPLCHAIFQEHAALDGKGSAVKFEFVGMGAGPGAAAVAGRWGLERRSLKVHLHLRGSGHVQQKEDC